jgi:cytoskeleton-associated protein 5
MADEATAIQEAKKLPWVDRLAHTNWKVRSAAFDDINVACNGVYDENDPCLHEFGAKTLGKGLLSNCKTRAQQ